MNIQNPFKWRHFESDIILLCVRWYLHVRHVTRDEIPGATRKNLEECSWITG